MTDSELVVGISGLDAGSNPQPGTAVAHALSCDPEFQGRIVALPYDPMLGGAFMDDIFSACHPVPWPGDPEPVQLAAYADARERHGINVLLPSLDSDVIAAARLAPRLQELGIATLLPSEAALKRRFKWNLPELARIVGIPTPRTAVLHDVDQIHPLGGWTWPVYIKGALADAELAHDEEEADYLFRLMAWRWGFPVLVQERCCGVEYLVSGFRSRDRRLLGSVSLRKGTTSAAGKAYTGVTVVDETLDEIAGRILDELDWIGPFELEFMRDATRENFILIEINARFPAWISFAAEAGLPLISRAVATAAGREVEAIPRLPAGLSFARAHRVQQGRVADARSLQAVLTTNPGSRT